MKCEYKRCAAKATRKLYFNNSRQAVAEYCQTHFIKIKDRLKNKGA